ncbi:hypothetical protein [Micromonospora sp. WMMC250]|uniref:hypothetical protein n=1 Tax=Micromonospora sp. WMMC250 TaxID=3014781 RepID=UPI0022B687B6|nr:hypothetical protein [Micromonospora sp. WMMC250]MCZ7376543.1 hypothetical protein [Micromonospora sp. WMMC250]
MARLIGPAQAQRIFHYTGDSSKAGWVVPTGTPVRLYKDDQCSLPADVLGLAGESLAAGGAIPQVLVSDTLECPRFQFPDEPNPAVYTRILGGPVIKLLPDPVSVLEAIKAQVDEGLSEVADLTAALADFESAMPASSPVTVASAGAALTLPDQRDAALYVVTLTAATCVLTFPAGVAGRTFTLQLKQNTASRLVTWPVSVKWPGDSPPTLQTIAGAVDELTFRYDGAASVWRGAYVAGYTS